MLLSVFSLESRRKNYPQRVLCLRCDTCFQDFQRNFSEGERSKTHHFCCRKCFQIAHRTGGVLDDVKRKTFRKKYGVDNALQIPAVREQISQTNLKRYGHEICSKAESVKQKAIQTTEVDLIKIGFSN